MLTRRYPEKGIQFRDAAVEAGAVMASLERDYFRHRTFSRRFMAVFNRSLGSGGFSMISKTALADADDRVMIRSRSRISLALSSADWTRNWLSVEPTAWAASTSRSY